MKKPTKKEIEDFIKKEFPHIEFDGISFVESKPNFCYFKVVSFGRMIGQAEYELRDDYYWNAVRNHLKWTFGG
jgi:hypothetical protein